MSFIEWDDGMSVGVKVLDDDHKFLMSLINDLHNAMMESKGREVMDEILGNLVDYTLIHFQREEKYFEETGYPDVEAHKRVHKTLTDKVLDIQEKHENSTFLMSLEVMEFLKDWWIEHIRGTDKKYTPYLNNAEVS